MRTQSATAVAICMSILAISCRDIHFTKEGYKRAVLSGLDMIPEARQIEDLLGDSDHFISYSGSRSVGNKWSTEVFFYDRYILTMRVPVRMGYRFNKVLEVLEEPTFHLQHVNHIKYYGQQVGAAFNEGWQFSATEWKQVYDAEGDFSVIGIELTKDQPIKDFGKYEKARRDPRIKVQ